MTDALPLRIPLRMYADMVSLACDKAPNEAVGMVGFRNGTHEVAMFAPMENRSPQPRQTFFVMPHEMYAVEAAFADAGCYLGGVFHSHPETHAVPSSSDIEWAPENTLLFICQLRPRPTIRVWDRSNEIETEVYPVLEAVA